MNNKTPHQRNGDLPDLRPVPRHSLQLSRVQVLQEHALLNLFDALCAILLGIGSSQATGLLEDLRADLQAVQDVKLKWQWRTMYVLFINELALDGFVMGNATTEKIIALCTDYYELRSTNDKLLSGDTLKKIYSYSSNARQLTNDEINRKVWQ